MRPNIHLVNGISLSIDSVDFEQTQKDVLNEFVYGVFFALCSIRQSEVLLDTQIRALWPELKLLS